MHELRKEKKILLKNTAKKLLEKIPLKRDFVNSARHFSSGLKQFFSLTLFLVIFLTQIYNDMYYIFVR